MKIVTAFPFTVDHYVGSIKPEGFSLYEIINYLLIVVPGLVTSR